MKVTEREAFSKVLITIGQVYGKAVTPLLVKLYWQVLEPYDLPIVVKALEDHVQDPDGGQFMPKPADLIRMLTGNSLSQSLQAWSKVEEAIRLVGPYRSVAFDDPIIHVVLQEMGGWIRICQTSEKELPFVMKEFQNRFSAYRHQLLKCYPRHFAGISEHQNLLHGHSRESIALLGDREKAQGVLNGGADKEQRLKVSHIPVDSPSLPEKLKIAEYDSIGE